jgi:hypothetical protein
MLPGKHSFGFCHFTNDFYRNGPEQNYQNFPQLLFGSAPFRWIVVSIFQQIRNQPHLKQSWDEISASFLSVKILFLFSASALIVVNWGIEALKWKLLVSTVRPVSFLSAYKAVLSGVSFSVALPNRVGE